MAMTQHPDPNLPLGYFDDKTFVMHSRVYFHDTDAAGIVYHGTYLHFAERARTEMLRHLKVDPDWLWQAHRLRFVIVSADMTFRRPAKHDDLISIRTKYRKTTAARMVLDQDMFVDDALCTSLRITVSQIRETGRPARLPQQAIDAMAPFLQPEQTGE
jgi:acyl-CoA thioester hydrolase